MQIASPKEPVYYYECSAGRFRLVYFIPPEELKRLNREGRLSDEALADLPDGVDLGCTEPDFAEFAELYGYRPPLDPEALLRAFFLILSTTRDWDSFRGSGFIPAADLEFQLHAVEEELTQRDLTPSKIELPPERPTLQQRREWTDRRAGRQLRTQEILQELRAEGIDPGRTLRQQSFSKISTGAGKPAQEMFSEIHQKQRR